ncbi:perlucin-like protein [Ptychodera flava]|uniref:perlucin-like protein n=1 Tax=Ptychodera flava TaxID=63121 RepID=UPI00396A9228
MLRLMIIAAMSLALTVSFCGASEESTVEKFDDHGWTDVDNFTKEARREDFEAESVVGVDRVSRWQCIYHGTSTCRRSCFFFYTGHHYTWHQAITQCKLHGGTLATIDDAVEDAFIGAFSYRQKSTMWIGLNDRAIEGIWKWYSGSKVEYFNWAARQPDNWRGNEDCVEIWDREKGLWNDRKCTEKRGYICKK